MYVLYFPKVFRLHGRDLTWFFGFMGIVVFESLYYSFVQAFDGIPDRWSYFFAYYQVFVMYIIARSLFVDPVVLKRSLQVLSIVVVLFAILSAVDAPIFVEETAGRQGIEALNLNTQAVFYGMVLLGIFIWFIRSWPRIPWHQMRPYIFLASASVCAIALGKTGSRGGFLAFLVGIAVVLFVNFRARHLPAYFLFIPLLLIGLAVIFYHAEILKMRLEQTFTGEDTGSRLELIQIGFEMVRERPLFGWTPAYVYPLGWRRGVDRQGVHNFYLQMFLSFGIAGALFFFIGLFHSFLYVLRSPPSYYRTLFLSMGIALLAYGATAHIGYQKYFWLFLAMLPQIQYFQYHEQFENQVFIPYDIEPPLEVE